MTDAQALIRYARDRDADAFGQLVRSHQRLVYATARRCLGNDADAEEATQETFLRLAKNAGRVRGEVGGWLHRCATYVSIDRIRSDSARRRREGATALPEAGSDPTAATEARELTRQVDRAIAELKSTDRAALVGYYLNGRSQTELAREAGISQAGMRKRLDRALERVRTSLRGRGVVAAGGVIATALQDATARAQVPPALTENLMQIGASSVVPTSLTQGGLLMASSWTTGKLVAGLAAAALVLTAGTAAVVATNSGGPTPAVAPSPASAPDAAAADLVTGVIVPAPTSARLGDFDVTFETVSPQTLIYTEHPFSEDQVLRIGREWFPTLARAVADGGYEVTGPPMMIFLEDPKDPDDLTLHLAMPVQPDDLLVEPEPGLLARQSEPFACARIEVTGGPQDFGPAAVAFYDTLEAAGYELGGELRMVVQRIFEVDGQYHNDIHLQAEILKHPE